MNVPIEPERRFEVIGDGFALAHHLKIKLATPTSKPPLVATGGAAGMDLFLDEDVTVFPDAPPKLVGVGIHAEIPFGYVGIVSLRSGINNLTMINGVGIIDSDYRGEIKLKLSATRNATSYKRGDRLAQMVVIPYLRCSLDIVDELSNTERGHGGFGHTGLK